MTVRTDKIQALTGSAPLTLPSELPPSSRNVQVSTTGVLSTPAVGNSLNYLSNAGNSGYILLDHQEWSDNQDYIHLKMDGSGYAGTDIYAFEIWIDAVMVYSSSRGTPRTFYISPMNGDTSISLGQTGSQYYLGTSTMFGYQNTWMTGNGSHSRNGNSSLKGPGGAQIGSEWSESQCAIGSNWSGTGGGYENNYTSDSYFGSQMRGMDGGGFYGKLRYFNGFCGRGWDPNLAGMQVYTADSSSSGMYQSFDLFGASYTTQSSYPSNMQNAADGFLIGSDSTSNHLQGNFMLFGIEKAAT